MCVDAATEMFIEDEASDGLCNTDNGTRCGNGMHEVEQKNVHPIRLGWP